MGVARLPQSLVEDGQGIGRPAAPRQDAEQIGDHAVEREDAQPFDLLDVIRDVAAVVNDKPAAATDVASVRHDDVGAHGTDASASVQVRRCGAAERGPRARRQLGGRGAGERIEQARGLHHGAGPEWDDLAAAQRGLHPTTAELFDEITATVSAVEARRGAA